MHEHAKRRVRRRLLTSREDTRHRIAPSKLLRPCHWDLEAVRFGSWQNGLSASAPVSAWREAGECPDAEPGRETDETEHVKRSAGTKQSHSRNGNVGGVPAASLWSLVPAGIFSTVQFSNQFSRSFRTDGMAFPAAHRGLRATNFSDLLRAARGCHQDEKSTGIGQHSTPTAQHTCIFKLL